MAGRPKIFSEQQAIEKATEVFWDKCYDAASSDELLAAMGIGKGSFYLSFKGGKQELYERSIAQFADRFYNSFAERLAKAPNQLVFIRQFFLSLAEATPQRCIRGCYLGNALVQLSEKDERVRAIAAQLLGNLQQAFTKVIRNAQQSGELKNSTDPEILGWHLSNLWNGIHVTRRMQQSPEVLRSLMELNLRVLE